MPRSAYRVYADTSVFGGVFDEEFQEASRAFFEDVRRGRFLIVCSAIIDRELREAPENVRAFYESILPLADIADVTADALELEKAYLDAGILSQGSAMDALHVALATIARADLIVSWNFKHIVHFDKIRQFNAVNRLRGWQNLEIYSPKEVIGYEDENI